MARALTLKPTDMVGLRVKEGSKIMNKLVTAEELDNRLQLAGIHPLEWGMVRIVSQTRDHEGTVAYSLTVAERYLTGLGFNIELIKEGE